MKISIVFLLALALISCYRMPGPDDYSLVPATNNPYFTREKHAPNPGVGY